MNRSQAPKPNSGQVRTIRDSRGHILSTVDTQRKTSTVKRGRETVEYDFNGNVLRRTREK